MTKLLFIINSVSNYGRLLPVLQAATREKRVKAYALLGGTSILGRFSQYGQRVIEYIRAEFPAVKIRRMHCMVEDSMSASAGAACTATSNVIDDIKPDYVIVVGDRFETGGAVMGAYLSNACIVHFQGGEISGTLDEGTRHSITQYAHYHIPATDAAAARLLRMGVDPDCILAVGCPGMELLFNSSADRRTEGPLFVVFHPNTCDPNESIAPLLAALDMLEEPTVLMWPNIDEGANAVMKDIRTWNAEKEREWLTLRRLMHPREFAEHIINARACIGNSSSFCREAVASGTPVILLGDRQTGRVDNPANVCHVHNSRGCIVAELQQVIRREYPRSDLYGNGFMLGASVIKRLLDDVRPYRQKRFFEKGTK